MLFARHELNTRRSNTVFFKVRCILDAPPGILSMFYYHMLLLTSTTKVSGDPGFRLTMRHLQGGRGFAMKNFPSHSVIEDHELFLFIQPFFYWRIISISMGITGVSLFE